MLYWDRNKNLLGVVGGVKKLRQVGFEECPFYIVGGIIIHTCMVEVLPEEHNYIIFSGTTLSRHLYT